MNTLNTTLSLPQLLTVKPGEQKDGRQQFIGQPEAYGAIGIYGGHFVGQALAAGFETVDDNKLAQSFHCYFLRPGNPQEEIVYEVESLRDGKGSDSRSISAYQSGKRCFHMIANYKRQEPDADQHQKTMPDVKSAEDLRIEQNGKMPFSPPMIVANRAEMVFISDHFVPETFKTGRVPELRNWMRSTHVEKTSDQMNQCILAFLSDNTLMFNAVLPYGVPFQTHRLTSLDHSVWFHRLCDVKEWLLFDQRSTAAADGRGLNEGEVFNQAGQLIFSTSQESMLRKM